MAEDIFKKIAGQKEGGREPYRKRPGKFESSGALGELLRAVSLEGGADEEASYPEGAGWFGILRAPFDREALARDFPKEWEQISRDEAAELRGAGFIISEDSQGFFDYESFRRKRDLEKRWKEIEEMTSEPEEGEES